MSKFRTVVINALVSIIVVFFISANGVAQSEKEEKGNDTESSFPIKKVLNTNPSQRLEELQLVIVEKKRELARLKTQFKKAGEDLDLDFAIDATSRELEIVVKSFEQIVIGDVTLDVFNAEVNPKNWQEELTLVVKPLLENLRGITEKPRKRENLRTIIADQDAIILASNRALESIKKVVDEKHSGGVNLQLKGVEKKWTDLKGEAIRKKELATLNLANLTGQGDGWFQTFKESLKKFARERGLTLLLAIFVSFLIVLFFKAITKLIDRRRKSHLKPSNRTAYRVIAYAQRLLMLVMIVIGVLIVFFVRGDVLLLALMFILVFAAALGLRNFLPQFIDESRLLLNIGGVREQELVVINGVPWRVASINLFSILVNPELRGVLRLSLNELKQLRSRQIGDEKWFPSSIGDWVVDDSDRLYEVMSQSPDAVELQSAQGTNKLLPTADYYAAGFVNLTKSKTMRITSVFGVDYGLQKIALDEVPEKFQSEVQRYLETADLGTTDIDTRVEFQQAGSSSLDYLVIVKINSIASKHYYRIERYIQQACVKVCNEQGWGIPFPQLTVHKAD